MCFSFNSGAAGALTAMIIKRLGFAEKYWSLLFTINGGLTGMVRLRKPWIIVLYYRSHSVSVTLPSHQLLTSHTFNGNSC